MVPRAARAPAAFGAHLRPVPGAPSGRVGDRGTVATVVGPGQEAPVRSLGPRLVATATLLTLLAGCEGGNGATTPGAGPAPADPAPDDPAADEPGTGDPGADEPDAGAPDAEGNGEQEEADPGLSPPPGAIVLTERDDGAEVAVAPGEEVVLRLAHDWSWDTPRTGAALLEVATVDHLVDPGYAEWLLRAVGEGRAEVHVDGEPACDDPEDCPPRTLTYLVEVGPGEPLSAPTGD
ncbi:hypothetical protein GCM10011354_18390 [Egicoccus halophilus]|uniref:Uncharacterized protein n=1 Tax=Egicoccus halophilus TaxID=1670830 RepID=A0A8J3A805_9ACTN|nr:hypothetical protein GCM10011354_18390 [Egicoccus halophilus]